MSCIGKLRMPILSSLHDRFRFSISIIFALCINSSKKPKFVPPPLLIGIELNPGPRVTHELSEKQRWRIVFLSEENGLNPTEIAKKVGCTRHTVYNVLEKEKKTGKVKNYPKSGRKRKLTAKEEKKIVKKAQKVGATQAARQFLQKKSKERFVEL